MSTTVKKKLKFESFFGFALTSAQKGDSVTIGFQINVNDDFSSEEKLVMAQNMLDTIVYPEIIRRAIKKQLDPQFQLRYAHIVFFSDPLKNNVLFNDDVKIRALVRFVEGKEIQKGQEIKEQDIEEILGLYPREDVDPDAAHVMLVKLKGKWHFASDLIYCRKRVKNLLKTSKKFMNIAKAALTDKNWSPFVDNLFTVNELLVQSILLLRYYNKYSRRQSHNQTSNLFKGFCETGNAPLEFDQNFEDLWKLRRKARYLEGTKSEEFSLEEDKEMQFLTITENIVDFTNNLIKTIDLISKPHEGHYISLGNKKR